MDNKTQSNGNLNGYDIYNYIISGARKLILHEKYLNRINVFPVADGDTGSNLAFTMKSVIRNAKRSESVSETMESISCSAIENSYGNSGTIVAGYFNGLFKFVGKRDQITGNEFLEGLSVSVNDAYTSISAPQEGTILTVMRSFGNYLNEHNKHDIDFTGMFRGGLEYMKLALENTKEQLNVLKQANVVDAGAKGFVYFIEGIFEFITKGKVSEVVETITEEEIFVNHQDIKFRYCTEFIFEPKNDFDKKSVEVFLMKQGDSVIVTETKEYVKIHLHTENPEASALYLNKHGHVVETKVDDMVIQQEIANNRKYNIGVFTDSIADLPEAYMMNHQITVIPIQMIIDENIYVDRVTLTSDNTYDLIDQAKVFPTSSQPSDKYILKTLEYLSQHYDELVGVFVSSKMSGTFDKVKRLVKAEGYEQIKLIDSRLNSGGEALVVKAVCEAVKAEKSLEQVVEMGELVREQTKIFVKIPDLSYATKSGRVPKIVGSIAGLLNLKVIISIDNEGQGIVTKERSLVRNIKRTLKKKRISNYSIVHCSNEVAAMEFSTKAEKLIGFRPDSVENVSAIVAAFIGKGAVGIAYTEGD